jgi:hypothetical protein
MMSVNREQNHTVVIVEPREDPMHPLLAGEVAKQRIDERREWARRQQLVAGRRRKPRTAWRVTVGSHLIAMGCRLFLSGYATSVADDGSHPARSARRLSLEKTSTIG